MQQLNTFLQTTLLNTFPKLDSTFDMWNIRSILCHIYILYFTKKNNYISNRAIKFLDFHLYLRKILVGSEMVIRFKPSTSQNNSLQINVDSIVTSTCWNFGSCCWNISCKERFRSQKNFSTLILWICSQKPPNETCHITWNIFLSKWNIRRTPWKS